MAARLHQFRDIEESGNVCVHARSKRREGHGDVVLSIWIQTRATEGTDGGCFVDFRYLAVKADGSLSTWRAEVHESVDSDTCQTTVGAWCGKGLFVYL